MTKGTDIKMGGGGSHGEGPHGGKVLSSSSGAPISTSGADSTFEKSCAWENRKYGARLIRPNSQTLHDGLVRLPTESLLGKPLDLS